MSSKVLGLAAAVAVLTATTFAQAPVNDTPAGATVVFGPGLVADDSTLSAVDGPAPSCGPGTDDLWYLYVPAATGVLTVSTCPADIPGTSGPFADSVVAVFLDGGGFPGAEIGCADDNCASGFGYESTVIVPCTIGVPLYVSVCGWAGPGAGAPFVVGFAEAGGGGAAPNDVPAGAIVQVGPGFIADNNGGAASLLDGPLPTCGAGGSQDLWYYYVPTITGIMTATTCQFAGSGNGNANGVPGFDTIITVFADAGGAPGAVLSCNDDGCAGVGGGLQSIAAAPVAFGVGVYVSVCDWGTGNNGGAYVIDFTEALAAPNDDCLTALPLVAGPNVGLSNVGSTASQTGTCHPAGDPDVWYTYTAVNAGTVEFSMCPADGGSNGTIGTNAGLVAYHGVCGSLVQMECNDGDWRTASGCAFTNSRLQTTVTAGQTVYVKVSGFLGAQGTFDLGVNEFPSIPGHTCANAAVVTTGQYFIDTTSDGIAHDGNTPACQPAGDFNGNFVGAWYAWTAPCLGGTAILNTCATTGLFGPEDTVVEVWTGCPGTLGATQIGCNDDDALVTCQGSFFQSYLQFPVTAGQTYYLYVGGWEGGQGPITFDIACIYRHVWQEQNGPGTYSIQLENVDGPPNATVISAITLDIIHPGLPPAQSFPNGWFFGVPLSVTELITQVTWPGGLPFIHNLDGNGYKLNIQAPNGTTFGFGVGGLNASIWSVGVAFDPLTGNATILQTTDPTLYVIP